MLDGSGLTGTDAAGSVAEARKGVDKEVQTLVTTPTASAVAGHAASGAADSGMDASPNNEQTDKGTTLTGHALQPKRNGYEWNMILWAATALRA